MDTTLGTTVAILGITVTIHGITDAVPGTISRFITDLRSEGTIR